MNVNEPNRCTSSSSAATARARTAPVCTSEQSLVYAADGHLAELLRSLRSLAADSPERQAKIEGLMRAYAAGSLQIDAEATAGAIVDDATSSLCVLR